MQHADKARTARSSGPAAESTVPRGVAAQAFADHRPQSLIQRQLAAAASERHPGAVLQRALASPGRAAPLVLADHRPQAVMQRQLAAASQRRVLQRAPAGGHEGKGVTQHEVAQRVIINVGSEDLQTELAKDTGWIVASDMQIALQEGGYGQAIFELNAVPQTFVVGTNENIYLQGHGSQGRLGGQLPRDVAPELNRILPQDWAGYVRSFNCSSGAGGQHSGIAGLARRAVQKMTVFGANGVALNHPAYKGGTRTIPENKWAQAESEVDLHIAAVNDKWHGYVARTGIVPSLFKLDALYATLISESFYLELEQRLESKGLLLPVDQGVVKAEHA